MKNTKMVSPWIEYYRKVEAFFEKDPSVTVIFDDEAKNLKLFVKGSAKADALTQLLPSERTFGNVTMTISVIPANEEKTKADLFRDALSGNEALVKIADIIGVFTNPISYIIFEKEVVQYWNDDLSDAHGVCSTLYQELAKEIFGSNEGIFFCTDVDYDGAIGKPLGEWP